mmetsp:Transcript_3082/g.4737  ORF Transcript_3082/g.4737 Transcript_3082/m.4737 type:complete len:441 (+) Transcript_3082:48-1370(+)
MKCFLTSHHLYAKLFPVTKLFVRRARCIHGSVRSAFISGERYFSVVPPVSAPASPSIHFFANLLAPKLELSVQDTRAILEENESMLSELENDMIDKGMHVVMSDENVSVIDTLHTIDERQCSITRSLHFNENIDFIQTSVPVNSDSGAVDYTMDLPFDTASHIIGFSFAFLLHFLNGPCAGSHTIRRCAVLGAGGCTLPVVAGHLYPCADIHAVELSRSVIAAASQCFELSDMLNAGSFKLHEGCGIKWLREHSAEGKKWDLLFVDICNPTATENCVVAAPPSDVLSASGIRDLIDSVESGGILAINVLATSVGTAETLEKVTNALCESSVGPLHVGMMPLHTTANTTHSCVKPSDSMDEDDKPSLPARSNSIIFVVKTPSKWYMNLEQCSSGEAIRQAKKDFLSSFNYTNTRVRFPFDRNDVEKELSSWMNCYVYYNIK